MLSSSGGCIPAQGPSKPKSQAAVEVEEQKSEEYTEEMQAKMGTSLTYRHEDGINYNFILPDLIVGSCLQGPEDVDRLAKAGVTTVFNLQEDCDMEYFGIDIAAIQQRCREVGVKHVRFPVRDFDPFDLRLKLPKAVAALAKAHQANEGIAYIHCTAGLGRAPATALAYMYWLRGWQLPAALEKLTSIRACSPRVESIRAATADLLTDSKPVDYAIAFRRRGTAKHIMVAGELLPEDREKLAVVLKEKEKELDVQPSDAGQVEGKSDEYTEEMQAQMGTSLTYRHEDGINYNDILADLIVGSCLQTPEDVDRLSAEAGVTTVFSLQEDCDMEYFGIDISAIQQRCREVGVKHVRFPVRDFDPFDLRLKLPKAVAALAKAHNPKLGRVYIHCTAGLGRAPATALAYMYWLRGWQLPAALEKLTSIRACSPRVESIRAATADLLTDSKPVDYAIAFRRRGTAKQIQDSALRERLLSPTGDLTVEERLMVSSALCPWSTHPQALHLPSVDSI
eukprot:gene10276-10435_t